MTNPVIPNLVSDERQADLVLDSLLALQQDVVAVELARLRAGADAGDVMAAFDGSGNPVTYAQRTDELGMAQHSLADTYAGIWDLVLSRAAARRQSESEANGS